ncbi:hypothetical protein [Streptomyces sp. NPDC057623]|uniref:hypothetical protein n=1 Tax=Streptomyces sp. NPDC057623 TaxID=3346187 RepID=UPI0036C9E072
MRQCTATAEVPIAELTIAILAGQGLVTGHQLEEAPGAVRCELGLWHGDEHAAFAWDWEHKPEEALWVRWAPDGGTMRFESLTHCEIEGGADGDACWLYLDHPRDHSWNVSDPEVEAFRRRVLAENAGLLAWLTRKRE